MVQVSDRVGSTQNGSMKAVSGSGIASMSEASMLFQPRMLEPSKPKPSVKISSVNSRMGQLKCCQVPKVSTNLMSTILAPLFFANSITLLGVLMNVVVGLHCQIWKQLPTDLHPGSQTAASPVSSVRIRMALSMALTKTLPSPILPVLAAFTIASTAGFTMLSASTISSLILGRKSTVYS